MVRSIARERGWSLVYPALLGLGAVVLASCAVNEPTAPPQASAVRPPPPRYEVPAVSSNAPRPARKPTPPPAAGNAARGAEEEAYAATGPKPTEGAAGAASSAPPSDLAALSTSPGRSGQIPSQAELIGLDEPAATRLFGTATEKPMHRRQQSGATRRQVANSICSFTWTSEAAACGRCIMRLRAMALIWQGGRIASVPCSPLEAASAGRPMPHLLLVDDDDLFRELLGLNLLDEGYEVTSFANGREVLWPISTAAAAPMSCFWTGACRT